MYRDDRLLKAVMRTVILTVITSVLILLLSLVAGKSNEFMYENFGIRVITNNASEEAIVKVGSAGTEDIDNSEAASIQSEKESSHVEVNVNMRDYVVNNNEAVKESEPPYLAIAIFASVCVIAVTILLLRFGKFIGAIIMLKIHEEDKDYA